jgi:hypothetical protein
MTKPFYLKCQCGGKMVWVDVWECKKCGEYLDAEAEVKRYAAALGVAVGALETIVRQKSKNPGAHWWGRLAIAALQKIEKIK